jgi:hypothetical protein
VEGRIEPFMGSRSGWVYARATENGVEGFLQDSGEQLYPVRCQPDR